MLPMDQVQSDHYYVGQRLKVYVSGVEETLRGPRVLVTRTHPELVAQLFEQEVPEIQAGTVEIRAISREAGSRTKLAVAATQPGIDPVGSCVGGRGARVQAVLAELPNEKIDIVLWDEDPTQFITNALSPANVEKVQLFADAKKALVSVPEDQLSLAIGRAGQNVRLASRLTGWSIDIAQTGMEEEKLKAMQAADAEARGQSEPGEEVIEEAPAEKPKKRTKKATETEEVTEPSDAPAEEVAQTESEEA
jgi:transcription termination/antitermination protein NusA